MRTGAGARQRATAVLLVLLGLGIWAFAGLILTDSYQLNHHGLRATVTVTRLRGSGKETQGLVDLPLPDGGSASEWLGASSDAGLGSRVQVLYLADDPGSVTTRDDDQMAQWYPIVLMLPLGGVALWGAGRVRRAEWSVRRSAGAV